VKPWTPSPIENISTVEEEYIQYPDATRLVRGMRVFTSLSSASLLLCMCMCVCVCVSVSKWLWVGMGGCFLCLFVLMNRIHLQEYRTPTLTIEIKTQ
jgi:hypothetical protein